MESPAFPPGPDETARKLYECASGLPWNGVPQGGGQPSAHRTLSCYASDTAAAMSEPADYFARNAVPLTALDGGPWVVLSLAIHQSEDHVSKHDEILLTETFANFQKIILTHDLGFFGEFRRMIGSNHPDGSFIQLEGDPGTAINCKTKKPELQKAEPPIPIRRRW